MEVKLLRITDSPVDCIEQAASKCYNSTPSSDGRIMRHCMNSGHTSVIEHVCVTFEVRNVSRACLAQLSRHRLMSLTVESQRYVNYYEDGFNYYEPPAIIRNKKFQLRYLEQMQTIQSWYEDWINSGLKPEDARMVLPNCAMTNLTVTMNLRELVHFVGLRSCQNSQAEIRQLAKEMAKLVNKATDNTFAQWLRPQCEQHEIPYCPEGKRKCCGKHPCLQDIVKDEYKKGATS